jgi:hypothetical protein
MVVYVLHAPLSAMRVVDEPGKDPGRTREGLPMAGSHGCQSHRGAQVVHRIDPRDNTCVYFF